MIYMISLHSFMFLLSRQHFLQLKKRKRKKKIDSDFRTNESICNNLSILCYMELHKCHLSCSYNKSICLLKALKPKAIKVKSN